MWCGIVGESVICPQRFCNMSVPHQQPSPLPRYCASMSSGPCHHHTFTILACFRHTTATLLVYHQYHRKCVAHRCQFMYSACGSFWCHPPHLRWLPHLPLHRLYNHQHCQLRNSPSKAPSRAIGVWCYMAHDVQSELHSRFLGWAMLYGEDTSTCYPAGIYRPNVLHGTPKGGLHFPSHVTHNTTPLWACLYCTVTPHHSWADMSNTVTLQSQAQVQLVV